MHYLHHMGGDRNKVITVDKDDKATGIMDKMEAHEKGFLHRAFSIFVLNDKNELLIQQRAEHKYHSGGLWTNTCCSHPMPGENTEDAAGRRLKEEMGIECHLSPAFAFTYKADVGNGLVEHEYDHVFTGSHNGSCYPDPEEVMAYQYIGLTELSEWMAKEPESFTEWMKIVFAQYLEHIRAKE
jgi:isopentenyl-diphosphate delta-isomerase